ncbi:MAG TPA: dihydrodipicolinate reductase C-terminal domain-containing protein [Bacteroidales bacterium]|nr:dihydrodipicolinate reductase C-terminal domain-containing protein [Bacteroidales bacterium]HOK98473.1 dihydrodipicolinate reductase C-terminal domain-containing protein [Bacteroidales bacterium]HPO64833.1 dihydrodipicolinate reductase C-terminal domain-containing protein [Bacteroidales bacterium]
MIKIGLMGFGRAGKAVATVFLRHHEFSLEWVMRKQKLLSHRSAAEFLGIDTPDPGEIISVDECDINDVLEKKPVDYIVDFSNEESIYQYANAAAERRVKIVSAISHYSDKTISFLKEIAQKTVVFWSPNITLGVNYLMFAAKFLKKIAPWVDIVVLEEHFKQKQGVSGTALKIADVLDVNYSQISSIRAGGIVGKHEIIFGFPFQTVRLIHESISREAFGNGAIFVAKNLEHKETGFYRFEDLLLPYFSE